MHPSLCKVVLPLLASVLVASCAEVQSATGQEETLCTGVVCADENECTTDVCNPADGMCLNVDVDDGAICDFGAISGQCATGVCVDATLCSDAAVRCDDENECTDDSCNPMNGQCSNDAATDGLSCDFGGDPGVCTGGVCEDAMLCSDSSMRCNDGESCTTDTCDPGTGICSNEPRMGTCQTEEVNLGLVLGDCMDGTCIKRECDDNGPCDDNNQCTDDMCNLFSRRCINTKLNGGSCNSGNGSCVNGICLPIITLPPPLPPPILPR